MKSINKYFIVTWVIVVCIACFTFVKRETFYEIPIANVIKYISMAYAIAMSTGLLLHCLAIPMLRFKKLRITFFYIGAILLIFYTLLTLDTFIFRTWFWYPGILRYALYDAYGICYLAFILPGIFLFLGIHRGSKS